MDEHYSLFVLCVCGRVKRLDVIETRNLSKLGSVKMLTFDRKIFVDKCQCYKILFFVTNVIVK